MNLSTAIQEHVVDRLTEWIHQRLGENLRLAALPGDTGLLSESVYVRFVGSTLQVYVDGPAESYAWEWEFGRKADPGAEFSHIYFKRSRSGNLQRIHRTYKGGMKPQPVPKKEGGGGNPWRTFPVRDRQGTGKFQQAFRDTMQELKEEIPRILPRQITVTSLD